MAHIIHLFMAMPFIGVRLGIPMLGAGGNTTNTNVDITYFIPAIF